MRNLLRVVLVGFALFLGLPSLGHAATVLLSPAVAEGALDRDVDGSYESFSYGDGNAGLEVIGVEFLVALDTTGALGLTPVDAPVQERRGVLKYDLSCIPTGANIQSARLLLPVAPALGAAAILAVHGFEADDQQAEQDDAVANGLLYTSPLITSAVTLGDVDVAEFLQDTKDDAATHVGFNVRNLVDVSAATVGGKGVLGPQAMLEVTFSSGFYGPSMRIHAVSGLSASDLGVDGTYDSTDAGPDGIRMALDTAGGVVYNEPREVRGALEYRLDCLAAATDIRSIHLALDPTSSSNNLSTVEIHHYAGDGVVTFADLTVSNPLTTIGPLNAGTSPFPHPEVTNEILDLIDDGQMYAGFSFRNLTDGTLINLGALGSRFQEPSTLLVDFGPLHACNDGDDNDGDGSVDYPADPGCASPKSDVEDPACDDRLDNDFDGFCDTPSSTCIDGSAPGDPQCFAAFVGQELPICSDGVDNDKDGLTDYPADPQCTSATDQSESFGCGFGPELLVVLPLLAWARVRRVRRAGRPA